MAAGACALRAQAPLPPADSPTIGIDTLDVVNHPDKLDVRVGFDSILDRNHPEDLADSNITVLAEPSGSRLKPVRPGSVNYGTNKAVLEMFLAPPRRRTTTP